MCVSQILGFLAALQIAKQAVSIAGTQVVTQIVTNLVTQKGHTSLEFT